MMSVKTLPEWVLFFFRPALNPSVPDNVKDLFEVARGAMICSWSFYPLATVGAEHCYRALEAAVRCRCQQEGIPVFQGKKPLSLNENVTALFKAAILSKHRDRWDALRDLRNMASHPERQSLLDPGMAQNILMLVATFINELFP